MHIITFLIEMSDRCQYTITMAEHMRRTTGADSALHWVKIYITERNATLCTSFLFLLFLIPFHLFTIAKHYFAVILQYGVARCLFQRFLQKYDFYHFYFILFKRLSCEISFSDFVYLLLDRIAYTEQICTNFGGFLRKFRNDHKNFLKNKQFI